MNWDSSLGPDPGLRIGAGCGPVMELTRHGLSNHRKKRASQKVCLKDQVGGSHFLGSKQLRLLTRGEGQKENKSRGAGWGKGKGKKKKRKQKQETQRSEGQEKPGEKSLTEAFPWLMVQVFFLKCFGSKVSYLVTKQRACPRNIRQIIEGFQATGKCNGHPGLDSVWMNDWHRSQKRWIP